MDNDYLLKITQSEPELLKNIRQETAHIHAEHMICGPIVGQLLQMLVKLTQAKRCLELGTLTGYSALYIAAGMTEGQLITCEQSPYHAALAQKNFEKSAQGHKITLKLGNAAQTIQDFKDLFDFIFIDADKKQYPFYYETLIPKLRSGGIMVVDNALWLEKPGIDSLNQMAKQDPRVETLLLPVRDGVLIVRRV